MLFSLVWTSPLGLAFRINTKASGLAFSAPPNVAQTDLSDLIFTHAPHRATHMTRFWNVHVSLFNQYSIPFHETKSLPMLSLCLKYQSSFYAWKVLLRLWDQVWLYLDGICPESYGQAASASSELGRESHDLIATCATLHCRLLFSCLTPLCTINSSGTRTV